MKNNNKIYILLAVFILITAGFWNVQRGSERKTKTQDIFSQSTNPLTGFQKKIVTKFREGNVAGLAEYFEEEVSMTLLKESDFYTKAEAENVLLQFCQTYKPKKFFVKHHGANSKQNNFYLIGALSTTENKKFRVYISNNATQIETIEITIPENI